MTMPEIKELKDALIGEIAEVADWIVASLDTSISWPVRYQRYTFSGDDFFLIPLTVGHYPAVAVKRGAEEVQQTRSKILRFLSAMSWSESSGAIVAYFTGGGLPRPMAREKTFGHTITADLNLSYLPVAADPKQSVALALMREGRGLNHPAYAFLSFYRVLEAALPDGKAREQWVTDNLEAMLDRGGLEALAKLKESGVEDVGGHLYKSGRMAIAHAKADPIINPDEAADSERITSELPVMRGLAELAIERVLGVKTRHTSWSEHLYELEGFKKHFGAALVAAVGEGTSPAEGETIDLPVIDVYLRGKAPFPPLLGMQPVHAQHKEKTLSLVYRSPDGLVEFTFSLDFTAERIRFNWQNDVYCRDDGSSLAAAHASALTRFILEYVGNGELHILDSDSRELLSRVDAFIPVNYWANHEKLLSDIKDWDTEATRRKEDGR